MGDTNSESIGSEDEEFEPKVRWALAEPVRALAAVGRDAVAAAHGLLVTCLHLRSGAEHVYRADGRKRGDGVDALAGHKSNIFAFAEKVKHPRIFLVAYPSFAIVAELKDPAVRRYKGLCMMEGDLVAGFGGFPDYLVSLWNWRAGQRLAALSTAAPQRRQLYAASRSLPLVCQCWGAGLQVWEVAPCHRRTLVLRRVLRAPPQPLVAVCWAADGALYALDGEARLHALSSDGVGMVSGVEWTPAQDAAGAREPALCALGAGLLVCARDGRMMWLKRADQKWVSCWEWAGVEAAGDAVELLVGAGAGAGADAAVAWTRAGRVYRVLLAADDRPDVRLLAFKQRHITSAHLIAPLCAHVVTLSAAAALAVYETLTGRLVHVSRVKGAELSLAASPAEPVLAVAGAAADGLRSAVALLVWEAGAGAGGWGLRRAAGACLTHQAVSLVAFSPTGRELVAAATAAGHVFIYRVSTEHRLTLTRYAELGRGLADCILTPVGGVMRALGLVLFSDKYAIGERVVCIDAESGRDNKFAGKMHGPYAQLVGAGGDTVLAVPHRARCWHVLRLKGDRGATVSVRLAEVVESGHALRQYRALLCGGGGGGDGGGGGGVLVTCGADGAVILRRAHTPHTQMLHVWAAHRYDGGVRSAAVDAGARCLLSVAAGGALAVTQLRPADTDPAPAAPAPAAPEPAALDAAPPVLVLANPHDETHLEALEAARVREEAASHRRARAEVVRAHGDLRARLVRLLEENLSAPLLHRLPLPEFDLHLDARKERLKQAEREREELRLRTEAVIRAQEHVTAWIRRTCWDTMETPRAKLFAIFSHQQVENYPCVSRGAAGGGGGGGGGALSRTECARGAESALDDDLFRPWEQRALTRHDSAGAAGADDADEAGAPAEHERAPAGAEAGAGAGAALAGTTTHQFVPVPATMIPQTLAFSFLQTNWLQHIVTLNVHNLRLWFNKRFGELAALKRRELGLVAERDARLRFILDELNKLSDLRGSFHHLAIRIEDPEWRQEEQPHRLVRVEPEECSVPPYVSPSQVVVVREAAGPPDDFRERALNDMMDGVLEKLWHEEIKKPVPRPQCMLDKEPEQYSEEELRQVFEYEARVREREAERARYRRMLHAEYAGLALVLDEGVAKFNAKVKDTWLLKLRVDSAVAQENLNLMRLRRVGLDRLEAAEELERHREHAAQLEREVSALQGELGVAHAQAADCQAAYDALAQRDRHMDRSFKNHFADLSPIVVDQCYKFFKKRPKWPQRATLIPGVLHELAGGVLSGVRPPLLHPDCGEYFKAVEQLDQASNMPPVLDEALWATVCRLRRAKIDTEIRMRALVLEMGHVESAAATWARALSARRARLSGGAAGAAAGREAAAHAARDRALQLVLPAGQVELRASGRDADYADAALVPRHHIDSINDLILRVGELKLRMMRRQMEFRKGILAKEWEHAQMKMRLRHLHQELHSYRRLKIPKELQRHLREREHGHTDDTDHRRLEREMAANEMSFGRVLAGHVARVEELQVRASAARERAGRVERAVRALNVRVSERRLREDPLQPIRVRRALTRRMCAVLCRARLVRVAQAQHARVALLQTQLELLRLKTYPTLATFRTLC